jgi:alpha-D-ribose 1-methylphosphonate 5-triphosphate synthase subunit PhnL
MREAATFALADARVAVRFEAPGFAEWLDEVLLPGFSRVEHDSTAVTVAVHRSLDQPRHKSHAQVMGAFPCFVFDRELVSLPGRRIGEALELADAKYDARYVVGPASVEVHADGPWPRTRAAVLRVVRQLAVAQSLADGTRFLLHTSGVEERGRVLLLAGPKGAGKTTLVAHLASTLRAGVVSNDCALVSRSTEGEWRAGPVPITINVREETMRLLPDLFRGVPAVDALSQRTLAEADAAVAQYGTVSSPTRLKLAPALFAREVCSALSGGGQLVRLAFVSVSEDTNGFSAEPLASTDAARRLAPLRYGVDAADVPRTIFDDLLGTDRPETADRELIRRLTAEVPCVDLRVGPGLLQSNGAAADLLGELLRVP